ncbi:MAG: DUF4418 family protein [Clostridia bacterium]|nr:DUF4418 family protein [Clostridia bacterium]
MKKTWKSAAPACVILGLALVAVIGVQTFLSPCVHEDGSVGACHWAGRALLGIGCLTAALAALTLAQKNRAARRAMYLSLIPTALLGALTPGTLIALCKKMGGMAMRCRDVTQPAMILLFAIMLLTAFVGCLACREKAK